MTVLLVFARALSFGSGMILAGVMAFRWLVFLPAFAGATDEARRDFAPFGRSLYRICVGAALVLFLAGVALFGAVTVEMSGDAWTELDRGTMAIVLRQTQFGTVCLVRLVLLVLLGIALIPLRKRFSFSFQREGQGSEIVAGLAAIGLLVSLAWTGHAAAGSSLFPLRILNDMLHLLATAVWPAGLLPFALFLRHAPADSLPSRSAIRRFSAVSLFIVGVLIVTGIVNSLFLVGSFSNLMGTAYGRLLCLKLSLFLGILGIASWNRFRLLPLFFREPAPGVLRQLQGFVIVEGGLAAILVAVVGLLGMTPPPS